MITDLLCAFGIFCGLFIAFSWVLYIIVWFKIPKNNKVFTKKQIIEHIEYIESFPMRTIPSYAKDRVFFLIKQYFRRVGTQ
jgi:hypothetical protein